jgi:branched-chain amino acid transport system ATP-binding protein
MTEQLLAAHSVTKRFEGFIALSDFGLGMQPGERVGLIGPNGSGKSTFVNCLTGVYRTDAGRVCFDGRDITATPSWIRCKQGLARTYQIPRPFRGMTVQDNVQVPLRFAAGHTSSRRLAEAAQEILRKVGLIDKAAHSPKQLSQVELRKLELARALAARPKLLIADEAMAGLSESEVDEILELLHALNSEGLSILLIEHIMRAVMAFSQRVVVIVAGRKIADGLPDEVIRMDEVERAYLGE